MKSYELTLILWFFLGFFGAHKFYLRRYVEGVLYFMTLGGFGILWLLDIFLLHRQVNKINSVKLTQQKNTEQSIMKAVLTREILTVARLNGGEVRILWVMTTMPTLSTGEIQTRLDEFMRRGHCSMEVSDDGQIFWKFPDFVFDKIKK